MNRKNTPKCFCHIFYKTRPILYVVDNCQYYPGLGNWPCHIRCNRGRPTHRLPLYNLILKYADDTYLIVPASNIQSRSAELQNVEQWATINNLKLNRAKTNEIIITTKGKSKSLQPLPPLLPDRLCHVSFSRYSPLSLEVVEKPNKWKSFLAPFFSGGTTQLFYGILLCPTVHRLTKWWLSSVCRSPSAIEAWQWSAVRNLRRVGKTTVQFEAVCGPKFMSFWDDVARSRPL